MQEKHPLRIYTDGSSRGNPGPGGYGVVLIWGQARKELSCGYRLTTNNRMELLAVIRALESLNKKNIAATIYTDSQYVVNTVEKNGWIIGSELILKEVRKTKTYGLLLTS